MKPSVRDRSLGQEGELSLIDRFGVWLSDRQIRRWFGDRKAVRVGDFGCGYQASLSLSLPRVESLLLVDVKVDPALAADPKIRIIEGILPNAMGEVADGSIDVALCLSVLDHLWEPQAMLEQLYRVLSPNGVCLVNVPSWRGKEVLEFSAFRLHWSSAYEMNDHKAYYDPRDLWPMLVKAQFRPQDITCFTHKFGLNTFAVCRKPAL